VIDLLNHWLHLVSLSVYIGGGLFMALVFIPTVLQAGSTEARPRLPAAGLRIYDPLSIGALGLTLMSGAFGLTAYKAALGAQFFSRLGWVLGLKLLLVFILINLSAATSLGMGHRIVRTHQSGEVLDGARLERILGRIRLLTVVAIALACGIILVALEMTHLAHTPP
jgi:uncharacterized membrane protein